MTDVFKGADGQWYFNIKGSNGEIVATSEGYTRRQDAQRGLKTLFGIILGIASLTYIPL